MNNIHHSREGHFNPTSPHSSSGAADSFKGTPDTRLTAFSPDEGSTKSAKTLGSLNIVNRDAGPIKFAVNSPRSVELPSSFYRGNLQFEKDPFVVSSGTTIKSVQKLSPTASVFSPFPTPFLARGPASEPTGTPQADSADREQTSNRPSLGNSQNVKFVHKTLSTDSGLSRCMIISIPGGKVSTADIGLYLSELEQMGFLFQGDRYVYECGDKMFVRFANIRDACTVFSNLSMGSGRPWTVVSVSPREFSLVVEPTSGLITAHEGQLYLNVFATPAAPSGTPQQLETTLKTLLQSEGDLFAFKAQSTGAEGSVLSAVIEYCDNDMSLRAVSKFNNVLVNGLQVCITLFRPDIPSSTNTIQGGMVSPARTTATASDFVNDFQRMSVSRSHSVVPTVHNTLVTPPARPAGFHMQPTYGMMPVVYHGVPVSPPYVLDHAYHLPSRLHSSTLQANNYSLSNSMMSPPSQYTPQEFVTPRQFQGFQGFQGRRQNAMRVSRSPYHHQQPNYHNHVDVNRIREGTDVRTTIMLRNIPNKVDQAMLKRIVDESSWGKYDFMYLRIDFANDCNVGYAFINFVDPLDIIDFVKARANQRWNCFKSDKVAEISYATIQGKDCLVQKFRNSSVMLEAAHYRPKLYYTLNGPCPDLAGSEEAFPEPDNQSKMKRSCENAEHVGLFTPNAGQHFRDEQRRRRSQFDRGTRLAEMEEYDYDAVIHHNLYSPQ
ncbi:RNA recognition motif 2-domain-containing protein [Biscogniauxia mediterranea]|nr:RNA recognition motif 2-domain-containing protein [Biscogniauxia mediterranea]